MLGELTIEKLFFAINNISCIICAWKEGRGLGWDIPVCNGKTQNITIPQSFIKTNNLDNHSVIYKGFKCNLVHFNLHRILFHIFKYVI